MPLTMAGTAVFAHYVAGLPWTQAWLVGAVLSPTDPVFAAAIVGRSDVPRRLRHLLNVESGVNDGPALPVVVVLLAVVGERDADPLTLLEELALGIALGVAIPWVAIKLERLRFFQAADRYQPLYAFAIGLLVFGAGSLLHANLFLAAFAGGVTVATVAPEVRRAFHDFGDTITELLKLAALLVFGALMSPQLFAEIPSAATCSRCWPCWWCGRRPSAWPCSAAGSRGGSGWRPPGSAPRGSPRWSTGC